MVSAYKEKCDALRSQCYWFTLAIYTAVHEHYPDATETQGEAYEKRGKYVKLQITKLESGDSGRNYLKMFEWYEHNGRRKSGRYLG